VATNVAVYDPYRDQFCAYKLSGVAYSLGYDPRPTPSLLRVGMKLSDPDLLKTAEPLIYSLYRASKIGFGNSTSD
jgi:hypothetical protein